MTLTNRKLTLKAILYMIRWVSHIELVNRDENDILGIITNYGDEYRTATAIERYADARVLEMMPRDNCSIEIVLDIA